jgi:hypothetical protein
VTFLLRGQDGVDFSAFLISKLCHVAHSAWWAMTGNLVRCRVYRDYPRGHRCWLHRDRRSRTRYPA